MGSYYSKTITKEYLNKTDTADDTTIDQYGADQNQISDNNLFPYEASVPLTGGSITADIIAMTCHFTAADFAGSVGDYEKEKSEKAKGDSIWKGIISVLNATPTARTKFHVATATTQYRSEPCQSRNGN